MTWPFQGDVINQHGPVTRRDDSTKAQTRVLPEREVHRLGDDSWFVLALLQVEPLRCMICSSPSKRPSLTGPSTSTTCPIPGSSLTNTAQSPGRAGLAVPHLPHHAAPMAQRRKSEQHKQQDP